MAEQWYYRVFGEEFGPMPFDELKELAQFGMISAADEVRSTNSDSWVSAASVEQLGLVGDGTTVVATGSEPDIELPSIRQGGDEWFCKLGGQELGPLSFEELTEYAENEQLAVDDEVKLGEQGKWRRVGSIGRLVSVMPYKAVEKNIVPTPPKSKTPAVEQPVMDIADDDDDDESDLDDLSDLVGIDDLDDLNRIGQSSPPAGRTAPVQASVQAAAQAPSQASVASIRAAYHLVFDEAKAKIAESMTAHAEATFKAAEEQAKSQIAWASAPKADRNWFGWAGGVEFGPVGFEQVFGLAKIGQLKPNDLIKNGEMGQFGPSSNVPGLFNALAMIARATETLALSKSLAQHALSLTRPSPAVPDAILNPPPMPAPAPSANKFRTPPKSDSEINTASTRGRPGADLYAAFEAEMSGRSNPVAQSRPEQRPSPSASSPMSGGYGSPMSAAVAAATARPGKKPEPKISRKSESTWFSDTLEQLKEPKGIGSLCAIAVVLLIVGWNYLPKSKAADFARYQTLKQILTDVRTKRNNPGDLAALKTKAIKDGKEMADVLKKEASRDQPAKQCLLWAARDEMPRMFEAGLTGEAGEKNFASRLQEAAVELGLEPRKAIPASVKAAPLPDD